MSWGQLFKRLLEAKGVKRGRGKGNPHASESKTATVAVLAEELGVPQRTAERRLRMADDFEELPAAEKQRAAESSDPQANALTPEKI